jgi:hypothetical protein
MDKDYLLLKRASASRPSGQWNDDDFDVLANNHLTALDKFIVVVVIGLGVWCGWFFLDDLQCGLAKVRRALDPANPTHGYAATREAAMAAFAKS